MNRIELPTLDTMPDNYTGIVFETTKKVTYHFKNSKLHKEDGPAVIDGVVKFWLFEGLRHRLDGPWDGRSSFYIHGDFFTEKEYWQDRRVKMFGILSKMKVIETTKIS